MGEEISAFEMVAGERIEEEEIPKNLLQSDALYKYILETSVFPREHSCLRDLREMTEKHPKKIMATAPDEGQFLGLLLKLMGAKKTIEVGVFTGYSLLASALALPNDGEILALDINREYFEIGLPVIRKAGVEHKINFQEGPALESLDLLLQNDNNKGSYDFAFVDADKENYLNYHERLIELVKVGGVIAYDNTLWFGSVVAAEDKPLPPFVRDGRDYVLQTNKTLAADPRIEISQLSVGDGVTVCRRIC